MAGLRGDVSGGDVTLSAVCFETTPSAMFSEEGLFEKGWMPGSGSVDRTDVTVARSKLDWEPRCPWSRGWGRPLRTLRNCSGKTVAWLIWREVENFGHACIY